MRKLIVCISMVIVFMGCASTPESKSVAEKEEVKKDDTPMVIVNVVINNIEKLPNKRVAVVDFTDIDGEEMEEGKILAEQIVTKLSQIEGIIVIERKQIKKILQEQELSMTGVTESGEEAPGVGKILNVDAIVSGTIIKNENSEQINARMIDAETGEIYASASTSKDQELKKKEYEQLDQEQKERIENERKQQEELRKGDPEIYRLKEESKRDLARLKEEEPEKFKKVLLLLKIMNTLKMERPRVFLLVTEPRKSPKLRNFREKNPAEFKRLMNLRKGLKFVIDRSEAYKKLLIIERERVIRKVLNK
ncbi:MAG: hypothetical protein KKH98_03310 [Spirochaetes bacterium]|nr:hypothetical protein [Spirochaetota bacterium]